MNEKYLPNTFEGAMWRMAEECGELLHILGKTGRFGIHSHNPDLPPDYQVPHYLVIFDELNDVEHAVSVLRFFLTQEIKK